MVAHALLFATLLLHQNKPTPTPSCMTAYDGKIYRCENIRYSNKGIIFTRGPIGEICNVRGTQAEFYPKHCPKKHK